VNGDEQWRGFVNGVLYLVQFEPDLERSADSNRSVQRLIDRPLFDRPVQDTVDALRAALASGGQLTGGIPQPHDEAAVRSFLTQLVDRLEQLRPWPVQPYRMKSIRECPELLAAPVVGTLLLDWKQAADRLRRTAESVGADAVLVLVLHTGETVAIVDDLDQRREVARDGRSRLLSATYQPVAVLQAFRSATGFTAQEVVAVH
jgi:hypothetical protein